MHHCKFAARLTAGMLAISALITPALAAHGVVTAGGSSLNVRAQSTTNSAVVGSLADGASVEIVDTVANGGWYKIMLNGMEGYVSSEFVAADNASYVKVNTSSLNVRAGAGTNFDRVGSVSYGTVVKVLESANGWYHIDQGWISAEYTVASSAAEFNSPAAAGQKVADYALQFVGCPYVYGGSSPSGFDCSGFTKYVYNHFGVNLNRTAASQLDNGTPVSRNALQPGDLVLFRKGNTSKRATHAGLYIGNGKFVHASTPRTGVIVSSLSEAYYATGFVGGRRVL